MRKLKVVGIIAQNRALSSILAMMLGDSADVRVRVFDHKTALSAYLRVAPIHLLICDYVLTDIRCPSLVASLKCNPQMHTENMQIIALTRSLDRKMQKDIGIAGIDEIIVKPMSPAYIKERVEARLALPSLYQRVPSLKGQFPSKPMQNIRPLNNKDPRPDNVIPLFGTASEILHPELS